MFKTPDGTHPSEIYWGTPPPPWGDLDHFWEFKGLSGFLKLLFLKRAEEQMAEIQYRCEVAEKKRARSAFERFQEEKRTALEKAAYEAERRKQEEMTALTENLTKKLRNEAALQREIALGEALAVARVMTK